MGRKKSLSHHLSRRELDDAELNVAIDEFQDGSDRVAAIMGAALVESHLMDAIRTSLVDAFDMNALFHDQGAPFGTFKARIVAGRALGLYDERVAADLDIIRDIRNQFAHALLSLSFENPHIAGRCSGLGDHPVFYFDGTPINCSNAHGRNVSETRLRYEKLCWQLSLRLAQKVTELLDKEAEELRRLGGASSNALAAFAVESTERGGS